MNESLDTSNFHPRSQMDGVKVFSATRARERASLGERVTEWIVDHPELAITDRLVVQSSDAEFHCLTIVLFYSNAD